VPTRGTRTVVSPGKTLFGIDASERVGEYADRHGEKALLVASQEIYDIHGERIVENLESGGVETALYTDVRPDPTVENVRDAFRVWQDVLRAVAAVFASTASVCDVDEHRALVLMHAASDDDTELLVHHVAATLASLFPEVSSVPVLRTVARAFPDDGDDLNAIVASLL
ncbi:MAG: iron-containing alcohol dehydrogenase, partial [Spirochaetota bacterium]